MQTKHVDASERFVSLDDIYYYGGGIGLGKIILRIVGLERTIIFQIVIFFLYSVDQEAIISHKPRNDNELELQVGDKLSIAGNHWDGMSKGTNRRTNQVTLTFISQLSFEVVILHFFKKSTGRTVSIIQS